MTPFERKQRTYQLLIARANYLRGCGPGVTYPLDMPGWLRDWVEIQAARIA